MTIANAQQSSKHIAGQYDDGDCTLLIFEDNTFLIMAYATAIAGTLDIKDDKITFTSIEPAPFTLFGRKNSHIAGGKIMCAKFEKGVSLMNYTAESQAMESMRLVFNRFANCFSYPYVHHFETDIKTLAFACVDERYPDDMQIKPLSDEQYQFTPLEVYQFENVNTYNDFAVMFHDQKHIPPFHAKIVDNGSAIILLDLDLNRRNEADRKIEKQEIEDDIKDWLKTDTYFLKPKESVFLNSAYREFSLQDILGTNIYIHIGNDIYVRKDVLNPNGTYDQGDTENYHNSNVIYKYTKITPTIHKGGVYMVEKDPLFTVECK